MNGLSVHSSDDIPPGKGEGNTRKSDQRLRKSQRLTRSPQIREAFNQQQKHVGRYMVFWLRSGDDTSKRVAVVASRKVGNAVKRACARRKLRDVFRRNRDRLAGTNDVVLVARGDIIKADAGAIEKEFMALAAKAGVYKP